MVNETIQISESLYLKDFTMLAKRPPYQISISGVISNVQPEVTTRSGSLMRSFRLQDNTGRWVACIGFERAAEDDHIRNGNEVILFFANAQEGLSNGPGQCGCMSEATWCCFELDAMLRLVGRKWKCAGIFERTWDLSLPITFLLNCPNLILF